MMQSSSGWLALLLIFLILFAPFESEPGLAMESPQIVCGDSAVQDTSSIQPDDEDDTGKIVTVVIVVIIIIIIFSLIADKESK